MSIVLITGGSGLIGRALTAALADKHEVRHLTRAYKKVGPVRSYLWDVTTGTVDAAALEGVDHIVHLAGEPIIDRRWSAERLRLCEQSRTESARLLLRTAHKIGLRPGSFVSASGVGYYGAATSDHVFHEEDAPGTDTIGRLTHAWEQAVDEWSSITRVVKFRTPMVLAKKGGALARFVPLARWFVLAPLGGGRQWMPWVHIDDLVRAYIAAMMNEGISGAFNVCAGEQPQHRSFMRDVAHSVHRPLFPIPVPGFALRLVMGERAVLVLEGSRASSGKLLSTGFHFQHDALAPALADLLQ